MLKFKKDLVLLKAIITETLSFLLTVSVVPSTMPEKEGIPECMLKV